MTMYMNKDNTILGIWKELADSQASGIIKRALDISSNLKMFCTYKRPDRFCGIAFSFSQNISLDISPFHNLSEIEISLFKDNSYSDSKLLLIQLINREKRVCEIFATICSNIATTIQSVPTERESVNLVISQMRKWQDLFSKKIKNTLSIQEQQGLFGELLFLQKLLNSSLDNERSIESWVGPNKAPQDFQSEFWAVEVKTITSNKFPVVSINGEHQLDETTVEKLFLYNLVIELLPADGKTLPELISELRTKLSPNANVLNQFENKLIYYGYFDTDVEAYRDRHYIIRKENYYIINGVFPRIKKDELLLGVRDVNYSITLSIPNENIIPEREVINTILSYEGNQ